MGRLVPSWMSAGGKREPAAPRIPPRRDGRARPVRGWRALPLHPGTSAETASRSRGTGARGPVRPASEAGGLSPPRCGCTPELGRSGHGRMRPGRACCRTQGKRRDETNAATSKDRDRGPRLEGRAGRAQLSAGLDLIAPIARFDAAPKLTSVGEAGPGRRAACSWQ